MELDVIILSHCANEACFRVNNACIESLINSENKITFNILIIESFPGFSTKGFTYAFPNVTVITPLEQFNFNRFLNIGLSRSKNEWVLFSNNDVLFHESWLTEILNVRKKHPQIRSFCPFDRNSAYLAWKDFNQKPFHLGYEVPVEFVGWCFLTERDIFNQLGEFDEQFDLYFQDNDFALTLKKHSILHAMVPASFVEHIGGYTTGNPDASHTAKYAEDKNKFLKKWKKSKPGSIKHRLITILNKLKN